MYLLISLFAASLFLIALFFTLKEREIYTGRQNGLTRFLVSRSPSAELRAQALRARMGATFGVIGRILYGWYDKAVHAVVRGTRALVLFVAQRMIHAVRGEKMLSGNGGSSMYLKHLKDHKNTLSNGEGQV